ncbi:hypothetical protein [Streptomyces sp. NPDC053755]|uniref:hypothetical protein n=1 Tax=Streptomyces sp. NPDC053755 TaxID=3155815 RepID=UPI0034166414
MNDDRTPDQAPEQMAGAEAAGQAPAPDAERTADAGQAPASAAEPVADADAEADVDAAQAPGRAGASRTGWARTLLTVALPAVLVLGAIGGGVTYTAVTVSGADRSSPTRVWETSDWTGGEDPALGAARGNASTPLSKLLLPVPEGYRLGPDVESYGNDGELGDEEAVALLKSEGRGLAGKKRRDYEKRVDKLGVQGIAVRSFASRDDDLLVEVQVIRMKNKKRIHDMYEIKQELAELLEFPKGPKIQGHKNSFCHAMPDWGVKDDDKKAELDGMSCTAYDSELLVTVTSSGSKPFDKAAVAALVKKQLDHIESPGEYV